MPHEDPFTLSATDARRWIVVYQELVGFKADLLSRLSDSVDGFTAEAQAEVRATDLGAIDEQRHHYQGRLEFWRDRHWELEGLALTGDPRSISHRGRSAFLTGREFNLLRLLLDHPGRRYTAVQLAGLAWGDHGIAPEEVRTYVGRLRRRLLEIEAGCRITNVPRRGYALEFGPEADGVGPG